MDITKNLQSVSYTLVSVTKFIFTPTSLYCTIYTLTFLSHSNTYFKNKLNFQTTSTTTTQTMEWRRSFLSMNLKTSALDLWQKSWGSPDKMYIQEFLQLMLKIICMYIIEYILFYNVLKIEMCCSLFSLTFSKFKYSKQMY